jgi:hypothetical protein
MRLRNRALTHRPWTWRLSLLLAAIARAGAVHAQAELRCPSDWITSVDTPTVNSTQFGLRCDSYTTLPEGRLTFAIHSVDTRANASEFAGYVTQLRALGAANSLRMPNSALPVQLVDGTRAHSGRHGLGDTVTEHVRLALAQQGDQAMLIEGSVFGSGHEAMRSRVLQLLGSAVGLAPTITPWIATATCPEEMQLDTSTEDFVLGPRPVVHCSTPDHLLMLQVHESRVPTATLALAQQEAMISAQLLDARGWVVSQDWEARKREWATIARNTRAFTDASVQGWISVREGRTERAGRPRFRNATMRWVNLPQSNGHHIEIGLLALDGRRTGRVTELLQRFVRTQLHVASSAAR